MIIYKTPTGIKKITPANGYTDKSLLHLIPKGSEYKIVSREDIPQDIDFDSALEYNLTFNIVKCKEIQKDKLRVDRQPLLNDLDIEVMQNITDSAKILEIEKRKQPLRDITKKVDSCKTIDEIKKVTI